MASVAAPDDLWMSLLIVVGVVLGVAYDVTFSN